MQPTDFSYITALLKERSGLSLTEDKVYLLESRLQPIARANEFETITELIHVMRSGNDEKLIHEVTQVMTTNESMFFRDNKPFDLLRQVILPELKAKNPDKHHLRIWSAACSSGQEPYSVAICLQEEALNMRGYTYDIVATDLCEKVVEKAKEGIYTQFEVQRGMPIQMLLRFFTQAPGNHWQVNDVLRSMITYKLHNLLESYGGLGMFDIVFCRNVLIYFDEEMKRDVLDKMAGVMHSGAHLILGSAETVMGVSDKFNNHPDHRGLYIRK